MQNRKLTPCPSCQAYYAIPPNKYCDHCANGCVHQNYEKKIKYDAAPKGSTTKVIVEVENSEINNAIELVTETINAGQIGDHAAMIALTLILIQYEKKLGTKIEVK